MKSFRPTFNKEINYELNKCFRCGFCRSQCPIYQSKLNETWNARGRMLTIQLLREGAISLDGNVLERIYTCALCKSCEEICPGLVKVTDIIRDTRRQLTEAKLGPLPEHMQMFENILKTGNVLSKQRPPELQEAINDLPQTSETIVFMGCVAQYVYPKQLLTLFKIMRRIGLEFTVLKDETCCGNFLAELGLKEEAANALEETAEKLRRLGVKKIITLCPMCYNTFRHDLPKLRSPSKINVQHSTQFLEEALRNRTLKQTRPLNMRLTYKDPCHLGRYAKIYDEPRNILRLVGVELIELERTREFSRCCGGTIRVPYSDLRNSLCNRFFEDVLKSKVDGVVTACPSCFHNLYSTAPYEIKGVFDIVEIVGYVTGIIDRMEDLTGLLE
ncbi:MAG: (Fe-S)-binding protein [Candidatus Bathyarchaeia archaeon]